jgi:PAS domain-containing protein
MSALTHDHLPLFHSWPLFDMAARMELASLALLSPADLPEAARPEGSATAGIGIWSCDLASDRLHWSRTVHKLFGLPDRVAPTRAFALACFTPHSRAAVEELRAHAIAHWRGFTLDAEIRRLDGAPAWIRITAMPVLRAGMVVRLVGTKQDITAERSGDGWRGF